MERWRDASSEISIQSFVRKPKNIQKNSKAWILIYQCNILIYMYQCIRLNDLYKLMKSFFQILNSFSKFWAENRKIFRNFGRKTKNIQKNSKAWILIKSQCVIYQWIHLNEFFKLMKSFFQISTYISKFGSFLKSKSHSIPIKNW